jgi:hypothetical protein
MRILNSTAAVIGSDSIQLGKVIADSNGHLEIRIADRPLDLRSEAEHFAAYAYYQSCPAHGVIGNHVDLSQVNLYHSLFH